MKIEINKLKPIKKIIKDIINPQMTRMEAWKAVQAEGVMVQWEDFKRIAGHMKLKFCPEQKQKKAVLERRFLTDKEIKIMSIHARHNFFFSCSWKAAFEAAINCAAEEFSVRATKAQAATAVNIAKVLWTEECLEVKRELEENK